MKRTAFLVFALLVPFQSRASVIDQFGFGPRGMSMSNAQVSVSSGPEANAYNPAGLTQEKSISMMAGYFRTATNLRINHNDTGVDEVHGSQFALSIPGSIGSVDVAMGLALYMPDARISRVRALPETQPRFVLFDNRGQHVEVKANFALAPVRGFSIGGGLSFLTSTRGGVALDGILTSSADEAELDTAIDVTFETARFPFLGIQWAPVDNWFVGATWRGESLVELDLTAEVEADVVGLLGQQDEPSQLLVSSFNTNFFAPQTAVFGLGYRAPWSSLFTLDIGWHQWSAFPSPTARVNLELEIPSVSTEGLLETPPVPRSPNFRDIVSFKSGVEHVLNITPILSLEWRGGLAFEPTPAPQQTGKTSYLDGDKFLATFGLGVGLFEAPDNLEHPLRIHLTTQCLFLPETTVRKENPASPVGDMVFDGQLWTGLISVTGRFPW